VWLEFFTVSIAILSPTCLAATAYIARGAAKRSGSQARRLSLLELRTASLETSRDELATELTSVANRVKMQRVRTANQEVKAKATEPDPYTDPEAWRKMMNTRIALNRIGGHS